MNMAAKNSQKKQYSPNDEMFSISYELFIAALSVLSVSNLILLGLFKSETVEGVILIMNVVLSLIFFGDFLSRLHVSKRKRDYFILDYGWADLLASLPFPQVKILRVFRLLKAARIMKKYGTRKLIRMFLANRGNSALLTIFFLAICVLEFGGILIIAAESTSANANIKTPSDALWWIFVTITTVGYGDRFPVTNWGRIVGVIVMITGIGVFGTLTGFLANAFLEPKRK